MVKLVTYGPDQLQWLLLGYLGVTVVGVGVVVYMWRGIEYDSAVVATSE